ncbi:hypothetical protein DU508_10530 [Pedobacter chinensis]|uniref:Uncharacterized protein n=1 Tax=Pedobacter chinensis TaxID=2282421 RepID=A0A369PYJ4_9SPHI|nr:hypothetical protein [Pedobacter chinensis]RDC56057.1 hypothetical protein DU508_10530 [Pedobacter chinensis]
MNEILKQKTLNFNRNTFIITEIGLEVKRKNLFSSTEYLVAYEDLGVRVFKSNKGVFGFLISSGILVMLSILLYILKKDGEDIEDSASLFYLGLAAICFIVFILTYKRSFNLVKPGNVNAIEFLYNNPNKTELDAFIETLISTRNGFLSEKYGTLRSSFSYNDNYRNILWLLNNDVINKAEYDKRIDKLNAEMNRKAQKIGFDFGIN